MSLSSKKKESFEVNGGTGGVQAWDANNHDDDGSQIGSNSRPNRHQIFNQQPNMQSKGSSFSENQDDNDMIEHSQQSERQMRSSRRLLTKSVEIKSQNDKSNLGMNSRNHKKLSSQRRLIPLTISSLNKKRMSETSDLDSPPPVIKKSNKMKYQSHQIKLEKNKDDDSQMHEEIKDLQFSEIIEQQESPKREEEASNHDLFALQNHGRILNQNFDNPESLSLSQSCEPDHKESFDCGKSKMTIQRGYTFKSRRTDKTQNIQFEDDESQASDEDLQSKIINEMSQKIVTEFTQFGQRVYVNANPRFSNYTNHFMKLLTCQQIQTTHPVISCELNNNMKRIMLILKESEFSYKINQFDIDTLNLVFTESFGGEPDSYIKMNQIQQIDTEDQIVAAMRLQLKGQSIRVQNQYAVAFICNGIFKIRLFGLHTRTQEEIDDNEFEFNTLLGINNKSIPNHGNVEPFIVFSFIDNDKLFVSLFHNHSQTHYHFYYSISERKIIGEYSQRKMETTKENLPQKCFLNKKQNRIHLFYRQGQSFDINMDNLGDYTFDKITQKDLGQVSFFDNTALISRSSEQILFYRLTYDKFTDNERWKLYHHLDITGSIQIQKATNELLIVNIEKLYFFKIDYETHLPILQNVINNFMNCTQLLFDHDNISLTYSTNKQGFQIRKRKYKHDFQVKVFNENLNQEIGITNGRMQSLLVTRKNTITIYDQHHFKEKFSFNVQPPPDVSDEDTQILSMQLCQNEKYLGVISGNMCPMNEQKALLLTIFMLENLTNDKFQYVKQYDVPLHDREIFNEITMDFYFKIIKGSCKRESVLIANLDKIIELNFVTKEVTVFYDIKKDLLRQPQQFLLNPTQDTIICASEKDLAYAKVYDSMEVDIDENYELDAFLAVVFDIDTDCFYLACNQYSGQLGLYILEIHEDYPIDGRFIMKWNSKLQFADANIIIKRDEIKQIKEMIVTYKQIHSNTYNIVVLDVTDNFSFIFKHEGFHFWEQKIQGFLLSEYYDIVTISSQGLHIISLGQHDKRCINTDNNQELVAHSLDSYSFLKLDSSNCIFYSSKDAVNTQIEICQEIKKCNLTQAQCNQSKKNHESTNFDVIYKVNIKRIQIRHLLLYQSLYICKNTHQLIKLVCEQPDPHIFYHALFELDGANMTSVLSFDNMSMKYLLQEKFMDSFPHDYPLFYKNKIQKGKIVFYGERDMKGNFKPAKYFYRSALDNAIKNNQVKAIEMIIQYIVKYQNVFTSSWLFKKNMEKIFALGIEVKDLLDSNVFLMEIQHDEWPSIHNNSESTLKAYNKSIFQLKDQYENIFYEEKFKALPENCLHDEDHGVNKNNGHKKDHEHNHGHGHGHAEEKEKEFKQELDKSKIIKIQYKLNLLPEIGTHIMMTKVKAPRREGMKSINETSRYTESYTYINEQIQLMDLLTNTDEIDVFLSETVQQIIDFKWNKYGFKFHIIGLCSHFYFMIVLCNYVNLIYILHRGENNHLQEEDHDHKQRFGLHELFSLLIIIGIVYPISYDLIQAHRLGWRDYLSDFWNWIDIMYNTMCVSLFILHNIGDHMSRSNKAVLQTVLFLGMSKTFFFLRLFNQLSPIVTMLTNVIYDLRVFVLFFMILILFFALQLGVLGICNMHDEGMFRQNFYDEDYNPHEEVIGYPGEEYKFIGNFYGNLFNIFRVAMGDFSIIGTSLYLDKHDNYFFWMQFFLVLVVTNIIFLNFLIAEAGSSYQQVQDRLYQYILREKAKMIDEAENMIPNRFRRSEYYPKYLIIRQQSL